MSKTRVFGYVIRDVFRNGFKTEIRLILIERTIDF